MYEDLLERLRQTARIRGTIHYGEIAPLLGLDMGDPQDRLRIGEILGEISKAEHHAGRPLLSAVVTHKEDERPGGGFYELAQTLGLARGMDREMFFIRELQRVHDYWVSNPAP